MRLNQRQESLANQGHSPDIRKRRTGSTPTFPARPLYGTSVFCECGWMFKTNESPTKGGNKLCLQQWEDHATYCVAQVDARIAAEAPIDHPFGYNQRGGDGSGL